MLYGLTIERLEEVLPDDELLKDIDTDLERVKMTKQY